MRDSGGHEGEWEVGGLEGEWEVGGLEGEWEGTGACRIVGGHEE